MCLRFRIWRGGEGRGIERKVIRGCAFCMEGVCKVYKVLGRKKDKLSKTRRVYIITKIGDLEVGL